MSTVKKLPMHFPVLRVNESHIRQFRSLDELSRMTRKYFDLGGFKRDAYFIDSEGKKFAIENVTANRRSWHIAYWFGPSPAIIVDVAVGMPTQQLTLDEMKSLVIDLVVKNRWYRQGGETEKKFRNAFEGFQSIAELMKHISFYGEWQG